MYSIMTRSGKLVQRYGEKVKQEEIIIEKSVEVDEIEPTPPEKVVVEQEEKKTSYVAPPPYKPQISFSERLAKTKVKACFRKIIKLLKKIYIDIPFSEVLSHIPTYANFLKEIISKKWKLEDNNTIALTAECITFIQNKIPPNLKYSWSFLIPC